MNAAAALALFLAAATPTVQETNDQIAARVLRSIAGHEDEPAGQVFKNVRVEGLKNVPARQFLTLMNQGYARALGVSCTHCHVENDFASDDKRPKRAAREMAAMHRMINERLRGMKELDPAKNERTVNCSTCHRGKIDPQADPAPAQKPEIQQTNDALAAQQLKSIGGHEQEPAEQVFMDIRVESLKPTPAARFISIMNGGYAKALGVACTHCHVEKDFSSDEKRPKRAAREMAAMHRAINGALHEMKELDNPSKQRFINCATCHRGKVDPTID